MSDDKPDSKALQEAVAKAPPHVRRDVPEFPFGDDATFMAYLPMPKAKTGGPIIRQFRTLGVIKASDGSTRYRFPRGRWPILATKVDSEGKQLFRFDKDPLAATVDEVQERQLEAKREKQKEIARQKVIDEQAEREEAERKARIEAEARVKVEMQMKEEAKTTEDEESSDEDDDILDDDLDFEDDEVEPAPAKKKAAKKKSPTKKKAAKKKSSK